jgi:dihydroflavonol-4-reductase
MLSVLMRAEERGRWRVESKLAVVTGATGHLGNVLVRELLSRGVRVRAVLAPHDDLEPLSGLEIERAVADVRDAEALTGAFAGADRVFHLAGIVSITRGQRALMESVNVGGTRAVVRACRAAGVGRLIHTGSVHALTEPESGALTEAMGFDPLRASGEYGKTKALACREVQEAARRGELDAVLVLPTGVLGPFDFRLSEMGQLLVDLQRGKVPFVIEGGHDFVDVRDVALGLVAAAERGKSGEAYLLGGGRASLTQLAGWVAQSTGARVPRALAPWLARAISAPAPLYERVTGRRALLTPYAVHALTVPFVVDSGKAARELGFVARPLETSVRDALAWHAARTRKAVVPGPGRALAGARA